MCVYVCMYIQISIPSYGEEKLRRFAIFLDIKERTYSVRTYGDASNVVNINVSSDRCFALERVELIDRIHV